MEYVDGEDRVSSLCDKCAKEKECSIAEDGVIGCRKYVRKKREVNREANRRDKGILEDGEKPDAD